MQEVDVEQYSIPEILGVWAAAALPMGVLAWVVVPALTHGASASRFAVTLIAAYTIGLLWQCVLVLILTRGQASRDTLWLHRPKWWAAIVVMLAVGAVEALPIDGDGPANRALDAFLGSGEGQALFHGNWSLFALSVAMFALNTVFGEELLFRGLLLPRMRRAFGRGDWIANAVLFGVYHLHQPWVIPSAVAGGAVQAWGTRRWRSAWIGIIAHSAQSVLFTALLLKLVVS